MPTLDEVRRMFALDTAVTQEGTATSRPRAYRDLGGSLPPADSEAPGWPKWEGRDGNQYDIAKLWTGFQRRWGSCLYTVSPDMMDATLHFGKLKGRLLSSIKQTDPGYLKWLLNPERGMNPDIVAIVKKLGVYGAPDREVDRPGHPWFLLGEEPSVTLLSSLTPTPGINHARTLDGRVVLIDQAKSYYAVIDYTHMLSAVEPNTYIDLFRSLVARKRS